MIITKDDIKLVSLDNILTWKFHCPKCKIWGYIDDDQFKGITSILCECGFHETIDLADLLDRTD